GIRAQLRMQSFVTGVLYVALDSRPDTPIVLRGLDPRVPELPTIPTDIEVWTAKLEKFAEAIEKVPLDDIANKTASILEDGQSLLETRETRELLPSTRAAIADARTLVRRLDKQIDPLFLRISDTLARIDTSVDSVGKLVLDVDKQVDPLALQAQATLKTAEGAL